MTYPKPCIPLLLLTLLPAATLAATPPGERAKAQLGVLIELELIHDSAHQYTDLIVSTLEATLDVALTPDLSAHLVGLYEEDNTEPRIEEAFLALRISDRLSLRAGQTGLPFGAYPSGMVSDPLTLEVGETAGLGAALTYAGDHLELSVFALGGDERSGAPRKHRTGGVSVVLATGADSRVGASYIQRLAASDTLAEAVSDAASGAGVSLFVVQRLGRLTLSGEWLSALDDVAGNDTRVSAWQVEAAMAFVLAGREFTFAIGHQRTREAAFLELPRRRSLAALSTQIGKHVTLALELAREHTFVGERVTSGTAQVAIQL